MMRHTSRINTHQLSSRLPRPDAVCPVLAALVGSHRLPRAFFQDGLIVEGPGIDLGGNDVIDIVLVISDIILTISVQ